MAFIANICFRVYTELLDYVNFIFDSRRWQNDLQAYRRFISFDSPEITV